MSYIGGKLDVAYAAPTGNGYSNTYGGSFQTENSLNGYASAAPIKAVAVEAVEVNGNIPTAQVVSSEYATSIESFNINNQANYYNSTSASIVAPSSATSRFDRSFFAAYDKVVGEIRSLAYVDSSLKDTERSLKSDVFNLNKAKHGLARNKKSQEKKEKRINRNENPRFLHYLQFNRKEKVLRLKGEFKTLQDEEARLQGDSQRFQQNINQLTQQKSTLLNLKERKQKLENTQRQWFDQVLDFTPPTPRLSQIQSNVLLQNGEIAKENALLTQVDTVISRIRHAQQLYHKSLQLLRRAQGLNAGAAITNFGRGGGFELIETAQQAQRDNLINQSQIPATEGGLEMERAWRIFPEEARRRHPELSAQIGRSPLPKLRGAHFGGTLAVKFIGGDFGDAINGGYAAGKIRENERIVRECLRIVDSQHALVVALRQGILQNVNQMKQNLDTLNQQRNEERLFIFNSVKAAAV